MDFIAVDHRPSCNADMPASLALKNDELTLALNHGKTAYSGIRFEQSAQISQITLHGVHTFLTSEKGQFEPAYGFGLLHEFDILNPAQYADTPVHEGYHKIGVGVIQKTSEAPYSFYDDKYPVLQKLTWEMTRSEPAAIAFSTLSPEVRGMQYRYSKTLSLQGNRLEIQYALENTGEIDFTTQHYCHNFMALDAQPVGPDYTLHLSHAINTRGFGEFVNPRSCLDVSADQISWHLAPDTDFFIEHLSKADSRFRSWTLRHRGSGTSVSESVDFTPTHMNLWGKGHVISPEIFHSLSVAAGTTARWQRIYTFTAA